MAAHQAPPSLGFSRQEHWSGCHFLLQCMQVKRESEVAQRLINVAFLDSSLVGLIPGGCLKLQWVCSSAAGQPTVPEAFCGLVANFLAFTQVFLLNRNPNLMKTSLLSFPSVLCVLRHPVHASVTVICLRITLPYYMDSRSQSWPTLGDPMDCSCQAPLSMEIFQARRLEWVAISFSIPTIL